ncbi:DUF397 domain-containing protein [Actinomadura sp. NEAU-AAG7]|uniref:DUF397 domain-containing protein n=1 Tax=Actinomadura sp. NEAU-AAG7 TaxID=2839640 RepID=UPI001BE4D66F|nr:DUF397 domain-containing protein [Actinomadura sp. NEAU-AAG7]MBT2213445.1 DUF397 domain-containing protein [Actinomadura sp. NEAU-AAG7]
MKNLKWRKSSYTGANGGDCVELADFDQSIAVRDSKDPDGPKLTIARRDWAAVLKDVKRGRHDL